MKSVRGGAFGPPRKLLVPLAVFAATFAILAAVNDDRSADAQRPPAGFQLGALRSGGDTVDELQRTLERDKSNFAAFSALGELYYQKARETADPGLYSRAERAFTEARRINPSDASAITGLATLSLARHDFGRGLELALQAQRAAPDSPRPLAALADAQLETGRYREAAKTLDRMISLKPNLASYSRISYFRELHGDLRGASEAMGLAVSAGGGTAENVAYVQSLAGSLELARGRLDKAAAAYRAALQGLPGYLPAKAGLAHIAATRGQLDRAIRGYRRIVALQPLPEYAVALAETQLVSGRVAAARENLELVRAQARLLRAAGVNTDVEIALFEADHGDADEAVRLARRAIAGARGVRSQDALGWALTRSGRPREGLRYARASLALGSRDANYLYHAGIAARHAGRPALARRWLTQAVAPPGALNPYHSRKAKEAL